MADALHSITRVSELTGLTKHTLRWYEREGLIPHVQRDAAGHRRYDEAQVRTLQLLIRLRRTGMPLADIRMFVRHVEAGAGTHGRRLAMLAAHRERLHAQLDELRRDLEAVESKMAHYRELIAAGLECDRSPITDPHLRRQQGSPE